MPPTVSDKLPNKLPEGGSERVPEQTSTLLREGRNCWRIAPAARMRMLVDGEAYFSALREALRAARHTVFILGWDIDSRMQLTPNGPDDGFPPGLRDFLDALVRRRKTLRIYCLSWDFAMLYALEREWLPSVKLDWKTHRRLCFRLDGRHPTGASHHQKVVVIDQRLAFVGGLDLTRNRWDTSAHAPDEPARRDPSGHAYAPFHDVQALVDGKAAQALAEMAEDRWHRATGMHVDLRLRSERDAPYAPLDPWPVSVAPDMTDIDVAISRTAPAFEGRPAVQEIEALYLDAIASARHRLYFENQYFTAKCIGDALSERLMSEDCPDIAVVSRRAESGWLQEQSMGVLRARLYRRLREVDSGERAQRSGHSRRSRFRLYCPEVPGVAPACVNVHSKVMVVDDALLVIGSANLNNRSMALDTECNLAVAANGDARIAAGIARARNRLLAEHLGVTDAAVASALSRDKGLHDAIDTLHRDGERTLTAFTPELKDADDAASPGAVVLDPMEPIDFENVMGTFIETEARPLLAGRIIALVALLLVLAGMALAWRYTPLREWADLPRVMRAVERIRLMPLAPLMIMAVYVAGTLVMVPVTVLIVVTVVVFGPFAGAAYALAGTSLGAMAGYGVGRGLGRDAVQRFGGQRLNALSRQIGDHGLLAMIVLRLMPIAPFTLVNLVVGASRIRLRDCLLGTLIGMLPGILIAAALVDRVAALAQRPSGLTAALLGAVLVLPGMGVVALRRRIRRMDDEDSSRDSSKARGTAGAVLPHEEVVSRELTVASYNVHGCVGTDGQHSPDRIAQVLDEIDADIVALQEIEASDADVGTLARIATARDMHFIPGPTLKRGDVDYGNAIMTRFAPVALRHIDLSVPGREPRAAIDATLAWQDAYGRDVQLRVIATHLGLRPGERREQVQRLLECLANQPGAATVLMGDVNEWCLWGRPLRWLHRFFERAPHVATFPSRWPLLALDRIWTSPRAHLGTVRAHATPLARRASDHLPLVSVLRTTVPVQRASGAAGKPVGASADTQAVAVER
ncbi:VTT domain-containing protein [Pandoraea captiosa]|uniref:VTT domain-containing protein n=1 Tax=Pandoraea captiosa TaxID=2508302 RepID=UPI001FEBB33E|nr:VTT domain-containing protein [Pandoraea captiosa]